MPWELVEDPSGSAENTFGAPDLMYYPLTAGYTETSVPIYQIIGLLHLNSKGCHTD